MATTSFTIYSRYNPVKDKERLQLETGQIHVDGGQNYSDERLWKEAASSQFLQAQRPPPKFVPATLCYEIGSSEPGLSKPYTSSSRERLLGSSLSSWYRSLTVAGSTETKSHHPCPGSTPVPVLPSKYARGSSQNQIQKEDKNNWFIQKALRCEPPPTTPSTSPPTLPEILARDPPPLPSEPQYIPPVWTEIGPSNRGFVMLQKGGWNEGEALGVDTGRNFSTSLSNSGQRIRKAQGTADYVSQTLRWEFCGSSGDIKKEGNEIIDLTFSDSEEGEQEEQEQEQEEQEQEQEEQEQEEQEEDGDANVETLFEHSKESEQLLRSGEDNSEDINICAHGRKALLTPIATVLKLDRLGIGLKVKTEGPYKASVKRVTHNAASLAAHVRMADKARRRREIFGRGIRGYERQKRKEEEKRRNLLAYMNS